MKRTCILLISLLFLHTTSAAEKITQRKAGYTENKGQITDQHFHPNMAVKYLFAAKGMNVQLRDNGFSYDTHTRERDVESARGIPSGLTSRFRQPAHTTWKFHRVDIRFEGANASPQIKASDPYPYLTNNYTAGTGPEGCTGIRTFGKVTYRNLYDGIDLEFATDEKGAPKFNFIVQPAADPARIRWTYEGAHSVALKNGKIRMEMDGGSTEERIPLSYVMEDHSPVQVRYVEQKPGTFSFATAERTPGKTLVIDPVPNLYWSTYFGGNDDDFGYGICTDSSGNILVTGYSSSVSSIATAGAHQVAYGGNYADAIVLKFNSAGACIWSTYYGGGDTDDGLAIATDLNRNVYITGLTLSGNNISTSGTHQTAHGGTGSGDAFIAKFNASGVRQWATYFGGAGHDRGLGIATDPVGNVLVSGYTASVSQIAAGSAHQSSHGGNHDAFIAKFSPSGVCQWSTYYGSTGFEYAYGISSDAGGNVIATGYSTSTAGIATSGSHQSTYGGGADDAFIVKFNPGGQRQWATYYGGAAEDNGWSIATDASQNIFFIGQTMSPSGIATTGAHQIAYGGGPYDAYLVKMNASGAVQWATYFGGAGTDLGYGIAVDVQGNVLGTGFTASATGIATSGAFQASYSGNLDVFVARFSTTGTRDWSTYLGGTSDETGFSIASDTAGNIYVTGQTTSLSGIATPNAFQNTYGGVEDAFIARLHPSCPQKPLPDIAGPSSICPGDSAGISISGGMWYSFKWQRNGITILPESTAPVYYVKESGLYRAIVSTYYGCTDTSAGVFIQTKARPDAGFMQNVTSACLNGNSFELTDTTHALAGGYSRMWKLSSGDTTSQPVITKSFLQPGSYQATLVVTSAFQCSDSVTRTFTVHPHAKTGFKTNAPAQCLTNSFAFTDTSSVTSGSFTRKWSVAGDTTLPGSATVSKSIPAAGSYPVRLVTTTNAGCQDSASANITVIPFPSPIAGFKQNQVSACLNGNSFTFSDTSFVQPATQSSLWMFSDGPAFSGPIVSRSFTQSGAVTVKLVVTSNSGCKDSATRMIQVLASPKAGFTQASQAQCLHGNSFSWSDTSFISSGTLSRLWRIGNDSSVQPAPSKSFTFAGTYPVKLIATASNGCSDSAVKFVTVHPQPKAGFSGNISPRCLAGNQFSLNDTSVIASGTIARVWDFGDATTSSNAGAVKSYAAAGTYTVKLVEISGFNCRDSASATLTVHPQPAAGFTVNQPAQCHGNAFHLNDTSLLASGSYSRVWKPGDASVAFSASVSKIYAAPGAYPVTLITTSDKGCVDSAIRSITVHPRPFPGFTQNAITQCAAGNQFHLTDTSSIPSGTYAVNWNFDDGTFATQHSPSKSFTSYGSYNVKLLLVSDKGCSDSLSRSLTVHPQAVAAFAQNNTAQCFPGHSFLLTDMSAVPAGALTRQWNFGDTTTSSASVVNKSYATWGTYTVKLRVASDKGCADSVQKIFLVHPQPAAGFQQNVLDQCYSGNNFAMQDTSQIASGTNSRQWFFGDGSDASASAVQKSFSAHGNYFVRLVVRSDRGCRDSVTKIFTVHPQTQVQFALASPDVQCLAANRFLLNDMSLLTSGTYTRSWEFGDGNMSTLLFNDHSYLLPGIYNIMLRTVTDKGCRDSTQKTVVVHASPRASFYLNQSAQCLDNNRFTFTDAEQNPGTTRTWSFSDGTFATDRTAIKSFGQAGTYTVQLKIGTAHNCSDSASEIITVHAQPIAPVVVPASGNQLFTGPAASYQWFVNGEALNDAGGQNITALKSGMYSVMITNTAGCSATSEPIEIKLEDPAKTDSRIRIFPNPGQDVFHFDFGNITGWKSVELFDLGGKSVASFEADQTTLTADLRGLSPGMYIVRMTSGLLTIYSRIVKE